MGPLWVPNPKEKGASSEAHKSFSSEDLEKALAKQKAEHDASIEALVQMRIAAMAPNPMPLVNPSGVAPGATVNIPPMVQQPPNNDNSGVPWLYAKSKLEKPKYNPGGKPPLLDDTADFSLWRVGMQDHLRFANDEMLEILENGYNPVNPKNLTPGEAYDKHLNDTATMLIRKGMSDKQKRPYIHITNAKELWDSIVMTKTGTSTLRLAQYEIAKGALQYFCMEKGETPKHLLERLMTLAADIESYDCDKSQDGFNMTKKFLVDKLLNALAPYHHQMVWDIRGKYGFKDMSPDDVISTFQLFEESKANAIRHLAMHGVSSPKTNLALKAKQVYDEEQSEEDEDEEGGEIDSDEGPSYEDMALFVKKFSAGKFKGRFPKKKVRSCYNCEETNHFSNDCPYEKREDRPRFPKTFVKKKLPNPLNSKLKKRDGKAMVAQEESDPDDVGGVAGVAQDSQTTLRLVNKSGDVVTYNYMKDYKGNAHKCLMAKAVVDDGEQQIFSGQGQGNSMSKPSSLHSYSL